MAEETQDTIALSIHGREINYEYRMVDIDKILKIVKRYDLWFIEDNCDALGSKYKGRYTGTFGHISTCSFYPAQ